MAHDAACMAAVKNPSQRFGHIIGGVDDAGDVVHDDVASVLPFLDGKMLDVDVPRAFGGHACIDHANGRHVVFVDGGRTKLGVTQFTEDRMEIFGMLGSKYSSKKLSFGGGSRGDGLSLSAVRDGSAAEHKSVAGGGTTVAEIVGVGRIDKALQLCR